MPALFEADFLVILVAIAAVSLPIKWPRLRNPFAARRAAHTASVKARAVAANVALENQAQIDTFLARAWAQADYESRMAAIETAPYDAEMEDFYGNF